MLRELAALEGPAATQMREELASQAEATRARALEAAEQEHRAAIQALRQGADAASVARLTESLLALAGYGPGRA